MTSEWADTLRVRDAPIGVNPTHDQRRIHGSDDVAPTIVSRLSTLGPTGVNVPEPIVLCPRPPTR